MDLDLSGSKNNVLKEGFGLNNTRARLKQLYGNNYELILKEAEEGGLLVSVNIPYSLKSNSDLENGNKQ